MLFPVKKVHTVRGFTLIEILISVFILGAIAVVYVTATNTLSLTREVREKDIALRIIDKKLESLRAAGYAGVGSSGSFSDDLLSTIPNSSASTTISSYNANIKQVDVSVGWQEIGLPSRYLSGTTLIVDNGGL